MRQIALFTKDLFTRDFPPWSLVDLPQAWLKENQETHFANLNLLSPAASKGPSAKAEGSEGIAGIRSWPPGEVTGESHWCMLLSSSWGFTQLFLPACPPSTPCDPF